MDLQERETTRKLSRLFLCEILEDCASTSIDKKFEFLENKLIDFFKHPTQYNRIIKHRLSYFKVQFKRKWSACCRDRHRFRKYNAEWLQGSINFPVCNSDVGGPGRPQKQFTTSSERSKRRKTRELRENVSVAELTFAAQMSQRASGNVDASFVIKEVTKDPSKASSFRKAVSRPQSSNQQLSPEKALSLFVEANLSRRQYEVIQGANKNIYPCYSILKKAKADCYPESIVVTETCAEVGLQALLNHTAIRLCKHVDEVLSQMQENELKCLELHVKWGCDGSQQTQYKQKFDNEGESDSHIFQSSLVPLRLTCSLNGKIVWQNPVPSSPRYCRPIRIRFVRESVDVTVSEMEHIEKQIKSLIETKAITGNAKSIHIKHTLLLTMVDGKVCNAATDTTSTMRCYICGETSKSFNDLTKTKPLNPDALKFGLSTLHARIRCFETLLHVAYKLPIKKWQAKTEEDKQSVKLTKKKIQDSFKSEMGLLVDMPSPKGGNSNDGNTSRRFFNDPLESSEITGINVELIQRLKVILEAICSGYSVDPEKYCKYAYETAELYVQLYGWYPMTPTLHKILVHGAEVIKNALLPIGQLSEEAAETANKYFRNYRQHFARKTTRQQCNRDVLNRLLLNSDPFLSSLRKQPRKKITQFCTETLQLLMPEQLNFFSEDELGDTMSPCNSDFED